MTNRPTIAIIGAGPAGLMAAETLAPHGDVVVYDRMPSPARKFLMAGRGGLNLTHAEPLQRFLAHYTPVLQATVSAFPPEALRRWAEGLGQELFEGSSGRVFPRAMKASPLLRAWLARLAAMGVRLAMLQDWQGWEGGAMVFDGPGGRHPVRADAVVLALGGASWPRLGADGGWAARLDPSSLRPFTPSNMGFSVAWSGVFRDRFAGQPLKRIGLSFDGRAVRGEAMVTASGLEGGAVYALSAPIRDAIAARGPVTVTIDLRPDLSAGALAARLPEGQSVCNRLRKAGLSPVAIGLVQEALHAGDTAGLPALVKALPVRLDAPFPLARAISSAGGLRLDALDDRFMLRDRPGVFAAGEMLDWEAPTGGYLLQGCFSTAVAASRGVVGWLSETARRSP